jgi:ketosteroid isomerase-like protein
MMAAGGRELIERYARAMSARDWSTAGSLLADDFVEDYPQSGDRIEGRRNYLAVIENYPGEISAGSAAPDPEVVGGDEHWVMTPAFTTLRVEGRGERYTVILSARYPDESEWFIVSLVTLRGDRIARARTFFAPMFPAPEWRRPYVTNTTDMAEQISG